MEESPHKCPVCSRSFNQRSNLKTHLLTHTDHKPYECNSCGKVFRRNCDLRRHALTHAVGDVLPEVLAEGFPPGEIPHQEITESRSRSPERRIDYRSSSPVELTKCHHDESSTSAPYTMRPAVEENPQPPSHPQLQIRRDLHHLKPSTITRSEETTIFRKRIHESTEIIHKHTEIIRHSSALSHEPQAGPSKIEVAKSPPIPSTSTCIPGVTDLTVKRDLTPVRPPAPPERPPPKKHGFSIEDIMRRD